MSCLKTRLPACANRTEFGLRAEPGKNAAHPSRLGRPVRDCGAIGSVGASCGSSIFRGVGELPGFAGWKVVFLAIWTETAPQAVHRPRASIGSPHLLQSGTGLSAASSIFDVFAPATFLPAVALGATATGGGGGTGRGRTTAGAGFAAGFGDGPALSAETGADAGLRVEAGVGGRTGEEAVGAEGGALLAFVDSAGRIAPSVFESFWLPGFPGRTMEARAVFPLCRSTAET